VRLRGVPVFRYLGNYVVTLEIEPRYKIDERWSVLVFTGLSFGNTGRYRTATANRAKPAATIDVATASSIQEGT
jgi:hypothetical protein